MRKKYESRSMRWLWARRLYRLISVPFLIVAAGVATALFMTALCAASLYQSRQDALARATETSRNIALIAERDIERNLELYELSLQAVVDGIRDPEIMRLSPRLRRQVLFDRAGGVRISVFKAGGVITRKAERIDLRKG